MAVGMCGNRYGACPFIDLHPRQSYLVFLAFLSRPASITLRQKKHIGFRSPGSLLSAYYRPVRSHFEKKKKRKKSGFARSYSVACFARGNVFRWSEKIHHASLCVPGRIYRFPSSCTCPAHARCESAEITYRDCVRINVMRCETVENIMRHIR